MVTASATTSSGSPKVVLLGLLLFAIWTLLENSHRLEAFSIHSDVNPSSISMANFTTTTNNTIAKPTTSHTLQTVTNNNTLLPNVTILVVLSGEMGNYMSKLARAWGLQRWLYDDYNIHSQVVFAKPNEPDKYKSAMEALTRNCFPNIYKHYPNFATHYYDSKQQPLLFFEPSIQDKVNHYTESQVQEGLQMVYERLQQQLPNHNDTVVLKAERLSFVDVLVDRYLDDYRHLFWMNHSDSHCCGKLLPDPDESVFHYRAYATELGGKAKKNGYNEWTPNQTAAYFFQSSKVALVTRFPEAAQAYVAALEGPGRQVRWIGNQTGLQDFCVLQQTQHELVGMVESTFVHWAAVLGHAKRAVLYSMESPERAKSRLFGTRVFKYYNWTHADLKGRVHFELYPSV